MKKIKFLLAFFICFLAFETFSQVSDNRVDTYWSPRVVPVKQFRDSTWKSFWNKIDDGIPTTVGNVWSLTGNTPTVNTSFLGTTNSRSINFKTNNLPRFKFDSLGIFRMYTTASTSTLSGSLWFDNTLYGLAMRTNSTDVNYSWTMTDGVVETFIQNQHAAAAPAYDGAWFGSKTRHPVHLVAGADDGHVPSLSVSSQTTGAVGAVIINGCASCTASTGYTSTAQLEVNRGGGTNIFQARKLGGVNVFEIAATTGKSTFSADVAMRTGTDVVYFDFKPLTTATTLPAFYMGMATPNGTNYAIISDGTLNAFNSPSDYVYKSRGTNLYFGNSIPAGSQAFHEWFGLTTTSVTAAEKRRFSIGGNSIQFQTGNFATQRSVYKQGDTYSAIAASTITAAYTDYSDFPVASTNMVITDAYGYGSSGSVAFAGVKNHFGPATANRQTSVSQNRISNSSSSILDIGNGGAANSVYLWADRPGSKTTTNYNIFMDEFDIILNDSSAHGMRFNNVAALNLINSTLNKTSTDFFVLTGITYTTTTNTEKRKFNVTSRTVGFPGAGTLAAQRVGFIGADTYSAAANMTITEAAGLKVDAPIASTNVTITTNNAIWSNGNFKTTGNGYITSKLSVGSSTATASRELDLHNLTGSATGQAWSEDATSFAGLYAQGSNGTYYAALNHFGSAISFSTGLRQNNSAFLDLTSPFSVVVNPVATSTLVLGVGGIATANEAVRITTAGVSVSNNITTKVTAPSAQLHIAAGTTTAGTSPLKFNNGNLTTVAEAGTHEFDTAHYVSNLSALRIGLGGVIADFYADANNGTTVETDLYSYTTPANTLQRDGSKLQAQYAGTFNDLTATVTLKLYFGGTVIGNTGALTVSATGGWVANVLIIRSSSTTARAVVNISTPGASTAVYTTETDITGLTLSNTNILKITGTAGGGTGGSNDITGKLGTVSFFPKAKN